MIKSERLRSSLVFEPGGQLEINRSTISSENFLIILAAIKSYATFFIILFALSILLNTLISFLEKTMFMTSLSILKKTTSHFL